MLSRFTLIMLSVALTMLMAAILGSALLGSVVSPRLIAIAIRVEYFLNEYAWALRLWRYTLYAGVFLYWPTLGKKVRARDPRDWTDKDVRDWNGYRYRLMVILIAFDLAIIDQWFYRLIGVSS